MEANRRSEESRFRLLYFTYVSTFLKNKNYSFEELCIRMNSFRAAFNFAAGGRGLREIDLNDDLNAYGYLCRYCPMSTGLVRQRILEALTECGDLLSQIKRPKLQVLDLGSGPGSDVIGFCSALYETGVSECKQIDFTLVDYTKSWEHMSEDLEDLIRKDDYGFVTKLFQTKNISMEFLLVDLNSNPERNETFLNKLINADIILVTRLLQDLDDIYKFFKNIHRCMNPGALLVVIDSKAYIPMRYIQGEHKIFELIYEHPIEDSEGRSPDNFQLLPMIEVDEPYPDYQDHVAMGSNCRVFVFKKI